MPFCCAFQCSQARSRDCIEYHDMTTQCHVKNVPPASGCIVHAIFRFLQSCSNTWRMTCFWWQLTYGMTIHMIRLSLKKGCFEINVEKITTFAGCHLATHPKSWSCGSKGIGLYVILLLVLETSQYPSSLRPEEVALLVSLDGEYPSSGHMVLRFDLPQINEIRNLIVNPGFPLEVFRFSKLLVVSSYFLS